MVQRANSEQIPLGLCGLRLACVRGMKIRSLLNTVLVTGLLIFSASVCPVLSAEHNHDRDIDLWYMDHGKGARVARPVDQVHGKAGLIPLYDAQLRYFMETCWVKPIPINAHEEKLDGKTVDIVQTIVKGYPTKDGTDEQRVGFALDRKTHLPIKIIYYRVVQGTEHSGGLPLSDYVDVDGIQMPSKTLDLKSSFQINVDYDEQIFVREPSVEGGIKQWEKK